MSSFDAISVARRHLLLSKLAGVMQLPAMLGSKAGVAAKTIGGAAGKGLGALSVPGEVIGGAKTVGRRVSGMAEGLANPFGPPQDVKSLTASRFRNAKMLRTRGMPQAPGGGFRT